MGDDVHTANMARLDLLLSKPAAISNQGTILSVRGGVVDVRFDRCLPPIFTMLRAGAQGQIVVEVMAQIDTNRVRGVAFIPTQGLARDAVEAPAAR